MFFFGNKKKKSAKDLVSMAYKVYNYRCHTMGDDAQVMRKMIEELDDLILDAKLDTPEYESLAKRLETMMLKHGGKIYPLTSWADNVDMIIVAGILAIGVRSFFLQPFKIPTNSMYPSFYGMTAEVYPDASQAPKLPERAMRFLLKGASNYSLYAPESGELTLEINPPNSVAARNGLAKFDMKAVKEYFVWPTYQRNYKFCVGNSEVGLNLPADFSLDSILAKAFNGDPKNDLSEFLRKLSNEDRIVAKNGKLLIKLGNVKKGEQFLNFDILSGDMLFVDRFTYNFKRPKIGDAIVFRTKFCDGMTRMNNGVPDDKYYIKRLVGQGGDTLKVEGSTLMRNGKPIEGSVAFKANSERLGDYCGYRAEGALKDGQTVKIDPKNYYAMGDNSANSLDSRYWGLVPQEALVGKSLIIFYPFTDRWGASK